MKLSNIFRGHLENYILEKCELILGKSDFPIFFIRSICNKPKGIKTLYDTETSEGIYHVVPVGKVIITRNMLFEDFISAVKKSKLKCYGYVI